MVMVDFAVSIERNKENNVIITIDNNVDYIDSNT